MSSNIEDNVHFNVSIMVENKSLFSATVDVPRWRCDSFLKVIHKTKICSTSLLSNVQDNVHFNVSITVENKSLFSQHLMSQDGAATLV